MALITLVSEHLTITNVFIPSEVEKYCYLHFTQGKLRHRLIYLPQITQYLWDSRNCIQIFSIPHHNLNHNVIFPPKLTNEFICLLKAMQDPLINIHFTVMSRVLSVRNPLIQNRPWMSTSVQINHLNYNVSANRKMSCSVLWQTILSEREGRGCHSWSCNSWHFSNILYCSGLQLDFSFFSVFIKITCTLQDAF